MATFPLLLTSTHDASANFVFKAGSSFLEARFVQRTPEYFIIYLSSHNGCNQACRFCHLTQTKQTQFEPATPAQYQLQLSTVLQWALDHKKTATHAIHINFMARGEPLLNSSITSDLSLFDHLHHLVVAAYPHIQVQFKLSTIMPSSAEIPAWSSLTGKPYQLDLYFSAYSAKPEVQKRWIPHRAPLPVAFKNLYELHTRGVNIRLHWALIEDLNDQPADFDAIIEQARQAGLDPAKMHFNLVRYNPPGGDKSVGAEPPAAVIDAYVAHAASSVCTSRAIPRVGFDVKASCGMFVSDSDIPS